MNFAERRTHPGRRRTDRALRPGSPTPAAMIAKNHEEPRQRYLSPVELQSLAEALAGRPERIECGTGAVLAAHRREVRRGRRRRELGPVRLDRGVWTKPSSHTKQQRTHVVPLAAPARMLLEELRAQSTSKCLFPGPTGQPITTIKPFGRVSLGRPGSKTHGCMIFGTPSPPCWPRAVRACL